VAEADLAAANERVERLAEGPDAEALAQAQMRVSVAEAALAAARAALENNALRAPFAGTLASLDLQPGQRVGGGQAVATLADFSGWVLETGNLTEVEVVRVRPGQGVALVFDALPEVSLHGTVLAVRDVYADVRGDVTYTVRIALDEGHPALRWGMTAQATFEP
jgi:HlyD family secretion protein